MQFMFAARSITGNSHMYADVHKLL